MRRKAPRVPRLSFFLVVTVVTLLLWFFFATTGTDPVFGVASVRLVIKAAAIAATSFLFVTCGATLVLGLAASREAAAPATGLQRVLVYALLTFAASVAALRLFDVNLGAVLTTSAIVSAAIAFAMQPMLGSMIAGVNLHIDRLPRVGDGIVLGGQVVSVEQLGWRRVLGRRADGSIVSIPNARLADDTVQILPHNAPVRAEILFEAPFGVPPQRISDLAAELVSDFAAVDATQPIAVSPVEYAASGASLRYRIHCGVRRYRDLAALEGEVLRRLWYVFQRERLWRSGEPAQAAGPGGMAAWGAPAELARILRGLDLPWPGLASTEAALTLATSSQVLLFAPGERLTLPLWSEGCQFLLLVGEAMVARDVEAPYLTDDASPAGATQRLVPSVALHRARDELARHIGPYAEHAVQRAAQSAHSVEEIFSALALEIPDEATRARFLERVLPEQRASFGPGAELEAVRDAAGSLVCKTPLRARGEVMILAVPPSATEGDLTRGRPMLAAGR
jgi:small-conductance mechanosensitive channel